VYLGELYNPKQQAKYEIYANIRESKTQVETLLQVALKEALEPKQEYEMIA